MAPRAGQRQEVAFWRGGLGGRGWCSDGQGLSPGRGRGASQGRERNIESGGRRCSLGRREPELQGLGGAWAPWCCLGMHEGGGRGRFQEAPRVSLELRPGYSIG